jgi:uncharacterized membrane protein
MTEERTPDPVPGTQPEPPAPEPPSAEPIEPEVVPPALSEAEIAGGKTFAILSYALSFVGLPFFIIPLVMRNNDYSLYHAKQTLILWLTGIALIVLSTILAAVCVGVIIGLAGGIFLLVLNVLGLMASINGEVKPLPVIGRYGEEWFKGVTKV